MARIITEGWGSQNLYCASCPEDQLKTSPNNTRAFDFICPKCDALYQLKSSSREVRTKIVDSAYDAMLTAIESDKVPNLLVLHYSDQWTVFNLLLVPSFCFSVSMLEKRKPLSLKARRAGWIGCNILISAIPPDARIKVVNKSKITRPLLVRRQFNNLRALTFLRPKTRGWTLDVLRLARSLGDSFSLRQMYGFEAELSALYPSNKNIRPKIRQQLQVLRDAEILRFVSPGQYEFVQRPT